MLLRPPSLSCELRTITSGKIYSLPDGTWLDHEKFNEFDNLGRRNKSNCNLRADLISGPLLKYNSSFCAFGSPPRHAHLPVEAPLQLQTHLSENCCIPKGASRVKTSYLQLVRSLNGDLDRPNLACILGRKEVEVWCGPCLANLYEIAVHIDDLADAKGPKRGELSNHAFADHAPCLVAFGRLDLACRGPKPFESDMSELDVSNGCLCCGRDCL